MTTRGATMRGPGSGARAGYLAVLGWSFAFFNAARLVSYAPTLWALGSSGDSQQHSLLTWLTWTGANLTMAAWLHEQAGRRFTRAVLVNAGNAAMCLATSVLIVALRV